MLFDPMPVPYKLPYQVTSLAVLSTEKERANVVFLQCTQLIGPRSDTTVPCDQEQLLASEVFEHARIGGAFTEFLSCMNDFLAELLQATSQWLAQVLVDDESQDMLLSNITAASTCSFVRPNHLQVSFMFPDSPLKNS